MDVQTIGIYNYTNACSDTNLPRHMKLPYATNEAILLRLLLGQLYLRKRSDTRITKPLKNNLVLPAVKINKATYKSVNDIFSNEEYQFNIKRDCKLLDNYLIGNRRNQDVYKLVLFEISNVFISLPKSSITAFVHLYRCLEYISYTFPLVYAAKSKSYKGTFESLKSFLSGQSAGELKFFKRFIKTLYEDEQTVLDISFDIEIPMYYPFKNLKRDCNKIYTGFHYILDEGVMKIKFENMLSLFIDTRNKYFHMLAGKPVENFDSNDYDIEEYFSSITPHLLNWLAMIIAKISIHGFYSSLQIS